MLFAAEPIADAYPAPWCLRLDGESLWAIRQNGWFELGFQETYFIDTMARFGWAIEKVVCSETPWGVIFVATRRDEPVESDPQATIAAGRLRSALYELLGRVAAVEPGGKPLGRRLLAERR